MMYPRRVTVTLALLLHICVTKANHNTERPGIKPIAARGRVLDVRPDRPVRPARPERPARPPSQEETDNVSSQCNCRKPVANYGPTLNVQHISQSQGIYPQLAVFADSAQKRSECGIGAMMPWLEKLYIVTYLSVPDGGNGTGLYAIDKNMQMQKLASHQSTFANRLIHKETSQIIIGPWIIDSKENIRTFSQLLHVRITSTAEHMEAPEIQVYMLDMDGPLWECDVNRLNCTQLYNLVDELKIPFNQQPHFKAAHTMNGRLVVASNTFDESDLTGEQHGGRLAEWLGTGRPWKILETTAFVEVTGRRNLGQVIYAVGWDHRSAILKVFDGHGTEPQTEANESQNRGLWKTYRLPKASHAFDHLWQTEWPRIREVETERYLMDAHGMFYELSPLGWAGSTWGIRPISQHLRIVPDFSSYRGFLVLGGNQVSSIFDSNVVTGQSQSGLWFGKTDDLWTFGKPQGWGAVWRRDLVKKGRPSDPYLMTGFDKKVVHFIVHSDKPVHFTIEVDITGTSGNLAGEEWQVMRRLTVDSYEYYAFREGFSAHWVRVVTNADCVATVYFTYT